MSCFPLLSLHPTTFTSFSVISPEETITGSLKIWERPIQFNVQFRFPSRTQKRRLLKLSTDFEAAKEVFPSLPFVTARFFFTSPDVNFHHFKWLKIEIEKKIPALCIETLCRFYPANKRKSVLYKLKRKLECSRPQLSGCKTT